MHIGQASVDAVVADGKSFVIDPKQVHAGGIQIITGSGLFHRLVAEGVPVGLTGFERCYRRKK